MSIATPAPRGRLGMTLVTGSVRTKILGTVVIFIVAALASGMVAVGAIRNLTNDTTRLADVEASVSAPLQTIHQDQLKARMIIAQIAAAPTDEDKATWQGKQTDNDAELADAITAFEAAVGDLEPSQWQTFVDGWAQWQQVRDTELLPAALDVESDPNCPVCGKNPPALGTAELGEGNGQVCVCDAAVAPIEIVKHARQCVDHPFGDSSGNDRQNRHRGAADEVEQVGFQCLGPSPDAIISA